MRSWIGSSIVAGAVLAAVPLGAAENVAEAIAACRAHQSESERLACYDREADYQAAQKQAAEKQAARDQAAAESTPPVGIMKEPPAATVGATQSAAASPRAPAADEKFGYSGGPLARAEAEQKQKEQEARGPVQIVAKVAAISIRAEGEMVVTLENGQVWVQKVRDPNFSLKVGDEIKIEPGTFRSFLMSRSESKRTTRVTRLR